ANPAGGGRGRPGPGGPPGALNGTLRQLEQLRTARPEDYQRQRDGLANRLAGAYGGFSGPGFGGRGFGGFGGRGPGAGSGGGAGGPAAAGPGATGAGGRGTAGAPDPAAQKRIITYQQLLQ